MQRQFSSGSKMELGLKVDDNSEAFRVTIWIEGPSLNITAATGSLGCSAHFPDSVDLAQVAHVRPWDLSETCKTFEVVDEKKSVLVFTCLTHEDMMNWIRAVKAAQPDIVRKLKRPDPQRDLKLELDSICEQYVRGQMEYGQESALKLALESAKQLREYFENVLDDIYHHPSLTPERKCELLRDFISRATDSLLQLVETIEPHQVLNVESVSSLIFEIEKCGGYIRKQINVIADLVFAKYDDAAKKLWSAISRKVNRQIIQLCHFYVCMVCDETHSARSFKFPTITGLPKMLWMEFISNGLQVDRSENTVRTNVSVDVWRHYNIHIKLAGDSCCHFLLVLVTERVLFSIWALADDMADYAQSLRSENLQIDELFAICNDIEFHLDQANLICETFGSNVPPLLNAFATLKAKLIWCAQLYLNALAEWIMQENVDDYNSILTNSWEESGHQSANIVNCIEAYLINPNFTKLSTLWHGLLVSRLLISTFSKYAAKILLKLEKPDQQLTYQQFEHRFDEDIKLFQEKLCERLRSGLHQKFEELVSFFSTFMIDCPEKYLRPIEVIGIILSGSDEIDSRFTTEPGYAIKDAIAEIRKRRAWQQSPTPPNQMAANLEMLDEQIDFVSQYMKQDYAKLGLFDAKPLPHVFSAAIFSANVQEREIINQTYFGFIGDVEKALTARKELEEWDDSQYKDLNVQGRFQFKVGARGQWLQLGKFILRERRYIPPDSPEGGAAAIFIHSLHLFDAERNQQVEKLELDRCLEIKIEYSSRTLVVIGCQGNEELQVESGIEGELARDSATLAFSSEQRKSLPCPFVFSIKIGSTLYFMGFQCVDRFTELFNACVKHCQVVFNRDEQRWEVGIVSPTACERSHVVEDSSFSTNPAGRPPVTPKKNIPSTVAYSGSTLVDANLDKLEIIFSKFFNRERGNCEFVYDYSELELLAPKNVSSPLKARSLMKERLRAQNAEAWRDALQMDRDTVKITYFVLGRVLMFAYETCSDAKITGLEDFDFYHNTIVTLAPSIINPSVELYSLRCLLSALMRPKGYKPSQAIHICGHICSGKSTLKDALTKRLKNSEQRPKSAAMVNPISLENGRTVGLSVSKLEGNSNKRFILYDYGGDEFYHINHNRFLVNSGSEESIYFVVLGLVDVSTETPFARIENEQVQSKWLEEQSKRFLFWLNTIESTRRKNKRDGSKCKVVPVINTFMTLGVSLQDALYMDTLKSLKDSITENQLVWNTQFSFEVQSPADVDMRSEADVWSKLVQPYIQDGTASSTSRGDVLCVTTVLRNLERLHSDTALIGLSYRSSLFSLTSTYKEIVIRAGLKFFYEEARSRLLQSASSEMVYVVRSEYEEFLTELIFSRLIELHEIVPAGDGKHIVTNINWLTCEVLGNLAKFGQKFLKTETQPFLVLNYYLVNSAFYQVNKTHDKWFDSLRSDGIVNDYNLAKMLEAIGVCVHVPEQDERFHGRKVQCLAESKETRKIIEGKVVPYWENSFLLHDIRNSTGRYLSNLHWPLLFELYKELNGFRAHFFDNFDCKSPKESHDFKDIVALQDVVDKVYYAYKASENRQLLWFPGISKNEGGVQKLTAVSFHFKISEFFDLSNRLCYHRKIVRRFELLNRTAAFERSFYPRLTVRLFKRLGLTQTIEKFGNGVRLRDKIGRNGQGARTGGEICVLLMHDGNSEDEHLLVAVLTMSDTEHPKDSSTYAWEVFQVVRDVILDKNNTTVSDLQFLELCASPARASQGIPEDWLTRDQMVEERIVRQKVESESSHDEIAKAQRVETAGLNMQQSIELYYGVREGDLPFRFENSQMPGVTSTLKTRQIPLWESVALFAFPLTCMILPKHRPFTKILSPLKFRLFFFCPVTCQIIPRCIEGKPDGYKLQEHFIDNYKETFRYRLKIGVLFANEMLENKKYKYRCNASDFNGEKLKDACYKLARKIDPKEFFETRFSQETVRKALDSISGEKFIDKVKLFVYQAERRLPADAKPPIEWTPTETGLMPRPCGSDKKNRWVSERAVGELENRV